MALRKEDKFDSLFAGILNLKTLEECYNFFDDLCTLGELKAMGERYEAAKLLLAGETYEQVEKKTGMSSATISRVNRCLQQGNQGYATVIARAKDNPPEE